MFPTLRNLVNSFYSYGDWKDSTYDKDKTYLTPEIMQDARQTLKGLIIYIAHHLIV